MNQVPARDRMIVHEDDQARRRHLDRTQVIPSVGSSWRTICSHLEQGRSDETAVELPDYLGRARNQLIDAYRSLDAAS
ncbi:hypothetical protein GL325_05010 [Aeromicrobium sp. 636]|uniref:hypothetical protein n=1 Tax=Aeromicrobium TaxID=2040 RepID=UPI001CA97DD2|nr:MULTISPECIES: hypothetical protein [Aeromicrobium]MCQ3997784.1 hypothetical protein [Aeromicrobium sp. 636]